MERYNYAILFVLSLILIGCSNFQKENIDTTKNINLEILNGEIIDGIKLVEPKIIIKNSKYSLEIVLYNSNETIYETELLHINLFDKNDRVILTYNYKDCIIDNIKYGEYAKLIYNVDGNDNLSEVKKISIYNSKE